MGERGTDEDLERGRVVDKCCELLVMGKLDWTEVDPRILGYVLSYQEMLSHTGWIARAVKWRQYDEQLGFAGEFDVCFESGWILDLKAPRSGKGGRAKWHKLQTAAYRHLAQGDCPVDHRGTLYLSPDGSIPYLSEHRDHREDWAGFLACLNWLRTKEKYGNG